MPRRDGTGPMGRGAISGRGLGMCNGANVGGYGMRLGRGCGRLFAGESVGFTDKEILAEQKELLQKRLDMVSKQLEAHK